MSAVSVECDLQNQTANGIESHYLSYSCKRFAEYISRKFCRAKGAQILGNNCFYRLCFLGPYKWSRFLRRRESTCIKKQWFISQLRSKKIVGVGTLSICALIPVAFLNGMLFNNIPTFSGVICGKVISCHPFYGPLIYASKRNVCSFIRG